MSSSTITLDPGPSTGPGSGANAETPYEPLPHGLLARAGRPDFEQWLAHAQATRGCAKPVRLRGTVTTLDAASGAIVETFDTADLPDAVLYKACGDRREILCPACATVYRADTYQLLKAGLAGGKGIPETVATHPCLFVTLTAPSFGRVHSVRTAKDGRRLPCRPRRKPDLCPHAVDRKCNRVHFDDESCLGRPLCPDCYDYSAQAVWNGFASELWRRTTIYARRELDRLARRHGVRIKLSYAKVAEFQARGVVHFHALVRLDGHDPDDPDAILPPPPCLTADQIADVLEAVVRRTAFRTPPHPRNQAGWQIAWGEQLDTRIIRSGIGGEITDAKVVAYLAKYATKSTEATGGVARSLCCRDCHGTGLVGACHRCEGTGLATPIDTIPVPDHARRLMAACWQLGDVTGEELDGYRALRRWAHMLGFRGHFSTKSRRYSVTLGHLRGIRRTWRRRRVLDRDELDEETTLVVGLLTYAGTGWHTGGDAELARTAAAMAREQRRTEREERAYEA